MPALRTRSFNPALNTGIGKPINVFLWQNNPAEDADFASTMEGPNAIENVSVDRTGSEPVLRWTDWNGDPQSITIGPTGTYWYAYSDGPNVIDVTGYWECDQYGRPFDVNDLIAP